MITLHAGDCLTAPWTFKPTGEMPEVKPNVSTQTSLF